MMAGAAPRQAAQICTGYDLAATATTVAVPAAPHNPRAAATVLVQDCVPDKEPIQSGLLPSRSPGEDQETFRNSRGPSLSEDCGLSSILWSVIDCTAEPEPGHTLLCLGSRDGPDCCRT